MTNTDFSVGGKRINAFVIQRLLTNEVIRMLYVIRQFMKHSYQTYVGIKSY